MFLVPTIARADEVIINLNSETPYVDTTVEVIGTREYVIETFTGPRFETNADGTMSVRAGWLDSWIELRQGDIVLRADDDSNHVRNVNEYASKLTGTIDAGTYTIRATSYLYRVGAQSPTGNYVLNSNLIEVTPTPEPLPEPEASPTPSPLPVEPEPVPVPVEPEPTPTPTPEPTPTDEPDPGSNPSPEPTPDPIPTPSPQPSEPPDVPQVCPPICGPNLPPEPPIIIPPIVIPDPPYIPEPPVVVPDPPAVEPEPPIVEPEPPVEEPEPPVVEPEPVEEPPAPVEEPPVEAEEPPVEAEEPPLVEEEPPLEEEEPPALEEEPPLVADENSTEEEKELIAEALVEAAEGEAVTAEAIAEAGLTYDDLPPETPVEVRVDANGNQVVITAEVAAALVVLESPAELLNAMFTDPAQALLALGSIGADMSEEERAESQETIVAAVIVGGIATQSALTAAASVGTVAYRRKI